ncbi:MAG: MerR family transcriptional regulator [Candidatus Binataceae bacterium]
MARRRKSSSRRPRRGAPIFVTREVFCVMTGVSARQLAVWEHEEFLAPAQVNHTSHGIEQLYDRVALERVRVIRTLSEELDVNLPGIGVILNLLDQLGR